MAWDGASPVRVRGRVLPQSHPDRPRSLAPGARLLGRASPSPEHWRQVGNESVDEICSQTQLQTTCRTRWLGGRSLCAQACWVTVAPSGGALDRQRKHCLEQWSMLATLPRASAGGPTALGLHLQPRPPRVLPASPEAFQERSFYQKVDAAHPT